MADARRLPLLKLMAPAFAKFPPYTGQEPPDDYLNKVIQSWAYLEGHMTVLENANAGNFVNTVKCNILKSMMGGKYVPVLANNNLEVGNPAINSPDTLQAWMRAKYQQEIVGNQQSAIQRLTQEKYQLYDTSDTYETRVRPLLLGVADNDMQVIGFFKSHLMGNFYTWMRIANPAGINAFFTELKKIWLEHAPNLNEAPIIPQSVFPISDTQKMINETLAKQKSNYDAEIEKLRKEVQSSKAQKTQTPVPQTVEPVRQPRAPLSNLNTKKDYETYYLAKHIND
ncbi:1775_t:CDS:2 [Cetraspora pellucida]|uniref:1775_t:CDS:1 n=1 Tax=Cetraspora pellucida TaxID=1433469 RepID=A0A9N9GI90_9GLOM|nr:1775_t:CDS:2 [Cetraspora pellucida]